MLLNILAITMGILANTLSVITNVALIVGAVALYSANNKPTRESFDPALKAWIKEGVMSTGENENVTLKGRLGKKMAAAALAKTASKFGVANFENWIVCRVVKIDALDGMVWVGFLNDWYPMDL